MEKTLVKHNGRIYSIYTNGSKNTIYAVSKYDGDFVAAKATCHPEDKFCYKKGEELAIKRCELKILQKREKKLQKTVNYFLNQIKENQDQLYKYAQIHGKVSFAKKQIEKELQQMCD